MTDYHNTIIGLIALFCLLLPVPTAAQGISGKTQSTSSRIDTRKVTEADLSEAQRHTFAISLITSLAYEARSYHDLALRARVLARAAETLWNADDLTARALFRRAWEAAEKGDAEEITVKTKDNPPPMVIALKRTSGRDLRSEVLTLAARRDRALAEEFLAKLKEETRREVAKSGNSNPQNSDSWSISETTSKRLQLARKLLDDGDVERALEFAAPALGEVNANSIGFLSALRRTWPEAADQRFGALLVRSEFDPSSDANTVSGLSSYVFTPGLYVTFSADGRVRWTQSGEPAAAPNLPPELHSGFFQTASSILLRPVPPADIDLTSSSRIGKYMVIKRLLPLFDQYAPETATALRTQLITLARNTSGEMMNDENPLLTQGIRPEETADNALVNIQDRLNHARTSRERDLIYADAAVALAKQGDTRARDLADKVDDSDRRTQLRQYVDLELVRYAVQKKETSLVIRLTKTGQLTHAQRAWAYIQAARLLMNSQNLRAQELLEEAARESLRIDGDKAERTALLIGVAAQFSELDKVRAWEFMREVVKAANSTEKFTGEIVQITVPIATKSGVRFLSIGGEDFALARLFGGAAKEDLYRSVDLAKSFKYDAPRAVALLAIARALLI